MSEVTNFLVGLTDHTYIYQWYWWVDNLQTFRNTKLSTNLKDISVKCILMWKSVCFSFCLKIWMWVSQINRKWMNMLLWENWQTLSRSPKSKVKVKVDDWVFIKIIFPNHPPTPTHPHPRESFKKAIYSYISKTKGTSVC